MGEDKHDNTYGILSAEFWRMPGHTNAGEGGRRGIWGRLEENQGKSMQGAEVEIVQVT